MAEIEAIDALRSSLAQRRNDADDELARAGEMRMRIPGAAQLLRSPAVQFVAQHPAILGIAVGAIYLIGPLRLLRIVVTAASLVQAALSAHAAYQRHVAREEPIIEDEFD